MNRKHWLVLAAIVAPALAVATVDHWSASTAPKKPSVSNDDVVCMVRRLREQGVHVWLVPARADGDVSFEAYLVEEDSQALHALDNIHSLPFDPHKRELWAGTAKAVPACRSPFDTQDWGDRRVEARGWVFYGDPGLLVRIRDALK